MKTKIMLFALTISALVATGMFFPTFSYAGQVAASSPALTPSSSGVAPVQFLLTDGHHGGWHGRAFHGGGRWHGGGSNRSFYGGLGGVYVEPYSYYASPACDTVWDPYLNEWVCADYDVY